MRLKMWFYRDGYPKPGDAYPRPGHGRAAGAKQARVWEVGTVTGTRLSKIGGLLVFVGAVAFVLHVVLRSVLTAGASVTSCDRYAGIIFPLSLATSR